MSSLTRCGAQFVIDQGKGEHKRLLFRCALRWDHSMPHTAMVWGPWPRKGARRSADLRWTTSVRKPAAKEPKS